MAPGEILFAVTWLAAAAMLVLDLAGVLHRGAGFRMQAAGILVMTTAQLGYELNHLDRHGVFPLIIAVFVVFAGLALILRGCVLSSRERAAGRWPPRQ